MSEVLEEGEKKLSQCSTKGRELSQLRREVAPGHLSLNHTFVLRRLKPPSPLPAHFPSFQVGFRKCGKSERMCFPNLSQRPHNLQPKLLMPWVPSGWSLHSNICQVQSWQILQSKGSNPSPGEIEWEGTKRDWRLVEPEPWLSKKCLDKCLFSLEMKVWALSNSLLCHTLLDPYENSSQPDFSSFQNATEA